MKRMNKRLAMANDDKILARLKKLSPTSFENLSFDLMLLCGLSNAKWLTPGADGGRDIEGYIFRTDFSESIITEHWYVECKRYKNAVDWPTVYAKISYADNHNADYLLMLTTSPLSPNCKEEIVKRNINQSRPIVRYWDGTTITRYIERFPYLHAKYNLIESQTITGEEFLPAMRLTLNIVQSAYSRSIFQGTSSPELELSAALVDLISARFEEIRHGGVRPRRRFNLDRDMYPWCNINGELNISEFDSFGLRAALCAIKLFNKTEISISQNVKNSIVIGLAKTAQTPWLQKMMNQISILSNLRIYFEGDSKSIVVISSYAER